MAELAPSEGEPGQTRAHAAPNDDPAAAAPDPDLILRSAGRALLEQRLILRVPLPVWLTALLITGLAFVSSGLPNLLFPHALADVLAHSPLEARRGYFTDEGVWTAMVWSMLLGYVLAVMATLPRQAIVDTLSILRHLPADSRHVQQPGSLVGLRPETVVGSRRAGALWAVFGLIGLARTAWMLLAPESVAEFVVPFMVRFAWFIVVVPMTCFLIGRAAYVSLRTARAGEHDLLSVLQFHVLDPSPFDGLVRMTTRTAAAWIGGATIISLFLFNVPWRYLGATIPLALAACGMAAAAVWIPLVSINRRMRALKRTELLSVLEEIERDRCTLAEAAPERGVDPGVAARLTALLAYREAVQQAPEWPIGFSNGGRILVLTALPVLGWIAAALVERLLGVFL